MKKQELISKLGAPMESQMVANLTGIIKSSNIQIDDLLEISFYKKREVAFRAAWMLEYMVVHQPGLFMEHVAAFLTLLPQQKNPSAMRHYAKMVALLTDKKAVGMYKKMIVGIDFEPVVETLFTWLVDTEVLVAVKVHCMQALANLAPRYNWIKDELLETIDHLVDIESIAFFGRAKQVRKALRRV